MRCIFCLKSSESPLSAEHVFPDAIGGHFVIHTVCKPCNDRLGREVDCLLTDHWFIQGARMLLRLPGKSGHVPNPIENGNLQGDPNHRLRYAMDQHGKPQSLYTRQSVQRVKNEDGTSTITICVDKADESRLPEIVNKIRKRAGEPPLSTSEIQAQQRRVRLEQPWMTMSVEIDIFEFNRAILKIAYELACHWLGSSYLDDPVGAAMRTAIFDSSTPEEWSTRHRIRGYIQISAGESSLPPFVDSRETHVATMSREGNDVELRVQIFNVFDGAIVVSEQAERYHDLRGMFLSNNARTAEVREALLEDEIMRLVAS